MKYNIIIDKSPQIRYSIFKSVELTPEYMGQKFSRLDLRLNADDIIVNIEMQINNDAVFKERTIHLLFHSKHLHPLQNYHILHPLQNYHILRQLPLYRNYRRNSLPPHTDDYCRINQD